MSFPIRSLCNHYAAEVSGCKLEELSPHVCYIRLRQRIGEQIQKQLEEKLLQDEVKDRDKLQIREMHERMHPEYLKVQTQEGGAAHPQTPTFIACSDMQHVQYTYMGWEVVCSSPSRPRRRRGEEKLGDTGSIMDEALRQQMKEQERKDLRGGRPVDEETI